LSDSLTPESPERAASLRAWLACALLYYPAFWLALSLVRGVPALIQASLLGYHLQQFRLSMLGAYGVSTPSGALPHPHFDPMGRTFSQPLTLLLVLSAAVLLTVLGRRKPALSGFAIATLGSSALLPSLMRLFFRRQLTAQALMIFVVLLGIMYFGLRRMLAGWPRALTQQSYWRRAGILGTGFAAMPLLLWLSARPFARLEISDLTFWQFAATTIGPAVLAAVVASLRPPGVAAHEPQAVTWKTVGWCALTPLLLVAGVRLGDQPLNRTFARARAVQSRKAMAAFPEISPDLPYPKFFFQRGVNFTAEWPHPYASEGARQMLQLLPRYGINAIALVPYGWFRDSPPQVHIQEGGDGWESDEGLEELSRVAHARGIKVMLKPAIWESFNLKYPAAEDRDRWFDQYQLFLRHYARLAKRIHADVFCIGGEFVHLTRYEDQWRKLIACARELYPGPLVYAANFGAEFETIGFWDALDYIGLQEYYPLPDNLNMDGIVPKVEAVHRKYQRPVLFTEVGFPSLAAANRQPWDDRDQRHLSAALQASCYEAVYHAFYAKPWFEGMYWWKIETNGSGGAEDGSHSPWEKPAMQVLEHWYLGGGR